MNFVEKVVSFIKGVDAQITAAKIQKRATRAMETELSSVKEEILSTEDKLEEAKERYEKVLCNDGNAEFNRDVYVNSVFNAQNKINEFEDKIVELNTKKDIINKILEDLK